MAEEPEKKDEQMVSIPKSQLDTILQRLDILTNAADKNRLEWAMGQDPANKKPLIRSCNLRIYRDLDKGKEYLVLGWRMVVDEVFVSTQGVPYEKQIIRLFVEKEGKDGAFSVDEKGIETSYVDFVRRTKYVRADILGIETDSETQATFFKVKLADPSFKGRELKIDKTFVN